MTAILIALLAFFIGVFLTILFFRMAERFSTNLFFLAFFVSLMILAVAFSGVSVITFCYLLVELIP